MFATYVCISGRRDKGRGDGGGKKRVRARQRRLELFACLHGLCCCCLWEECQYYEWEGIMGRHSHHVDKSTLGAEVPQHIMNVAK